MPVLLLGIFNFSIKSESPDSPGTGSSSDVTKCGLANYKTRHSGRNQKRERKQGSHVIHAFSPSVFLSEYTLQRRRKSSHLRS